MKRTILAILPVLFLATAFQLSTSTHKDKPAPVITAEVKSRINTTLQAFVDSGKIAGVSALIFEKGKEVYFNSFGYADRESKRPMDRNTIVRIFSMTKPVTGVALMTLYDKGAFQLDDPLSKYLPEYADMKVFKGVDSSGNLILEPAKRPITIRDITRHTAGFAGNDIPALAELVRKSDYLNLNHNLDEMSKKLASLPLQFHPGDEWAYGPCVDVQARLVEKLSGKAFDKYIQETIFDPLKMTDTRYVIAEKDRPRFAALYDRSDDKTLNRVPDDRANAVNTKDWALKPGGWGLISTLDDYMKFAQMLVKKGSMGKIHILKPQTVQLMATNHLSDTISKRMWLPSKGRVGFGIDFAVRTQPPASAAENNGVVGEFFWDGAASTMFWVDPVNELTAVLFTQLVPFDRVKLHKSFRDAVYGAFQAAKAQ
ncbi:serine hydrolase domain-containing protein [Longitalea luteola]|uniref:serine hydrolase domain-containing protein n=1 Tax=Longitalea luteola TaxID=2812563 RepID=UPI001A979141|nr:serine hydrolase domain-containing protein [Longitalea luteola]